MSDVSFREITLENFRDILRLKVAPEQAEFVATNSYSVAEAHYQPNAWIRGIYAGDTPVGFVMLRDDPEKPQYYLWRFMIAAEHQGKGYGKAALDRLVEYVRGRPGATELLCSYLPGDAGPGAFYAKYGFIETGAVHDGENVISLALSS
jgi:diamine N-acetyltransferase